MAGAGINGPALPCENITVSNCRLSSASCALKFCDDNKITLDIDPRRPMAGSPLPKDDTIKPAPADPADLPPTPEA